MTETGLLDMHRSCCTEIDDQVKQRLIETANWSIDNGLWNASAAEINCDGYHGILLEPLGTFVTLTKNGQLRGCMGRLETDDALINSVSSCAFNAAFRDPRFAKLTKNERPSIKIEISILSQMMPMSVENRQSLLDQLKPLEDGLMLKYGDHRATFLPQVWEQLPDPALFIDHLLLKAGLQSDFWSESIQWYRYGSYSFRE